MSGQGTQSLEELRLELAQDEHQLSELEVILADYRSELARLVNEIGSLQTRVREAEEEIDSQAKTKAN
jgi:peptidoglycan hydrolase CwlO-like protein